VKRNANGSSRGVLPGHVVYCFFLELEYLEVRMDADGIGLSLLPGHEDTRDVTEPDDIVDWW